MRIIFLGLAIWNTIFFVVTIYLGETHARMNHFTMALITAIFTCLTHSVVYIHFLGTSKGIKEAVDAFSLPNDPETGFERRAKRYKARMRPMAMFAPLLVIVTTWLVACGIRLLLGGVQPRGLCNGVSCDPRQHGNDQGDQPVDCGEKVVAALL
jgi:hypothetical protein